MLAEGLLGIVTGVITTWLLFLGKALWISKVTPFLREIKYQGVKIDGAWNGSSNAKDGETTARLFLIQSAHELTGTFFLGIKNTERNSHADFNVRGYMWEGYITLNFIPKDRRITSYATSLLKLNDGGLALAGQFCFRDVQKEGVTAIEMKLVREAAN